MGRNKKRRAIELLKDALIVLLACSALWLSGRTQLMGLLRGLIHEERPRSEQTQGQGTGWADAALPMAMAVNLAVGSQLPDGDETSRYGVQYDQAACQTLFQQVAGPLAEALSSAGPPQSVDRKDWEEALCSAPGVYMDFRGAVPLSVLSLWLSGGDSQLDASVRRLVLTVREDGVALYYQDEQDGGYYRCQSQVTETRVLTEALAGLSGNGTFFAFESELYEMLNPDTLLTDAAPSPQVYAVSNPVSGGQTALEAIVRDLGFSLNSTSFYSTDEQVARSGDDMVRLSDRGTVQYTAGEDGGRFSVPGGQGAAALKNSVEACRQLAAATLGSRCGEARLYFISADPVSGGWEIRFGYSLNGIPVQLEEGYAARFLVEDGHVKQFTLHLRSYLSTGTSSVVPPPRQASAALAAQGLEGEELLLLYFDMGGDTLSAGWAAKAGAAGEE